MPKKLKLDLNDLKVNSFVTSLDQKTAAEVKGGWSEAFSCNPCSEIACPTTPYATCQSYYDTECNCIATMQEKQQTCAAGPECF